MFPSNYIDVKVPLKEDSNTSSSINSSSANVTNKLPDKVWPSSSSVAAQERTGRVLYDFIAEAPEDLTLKVKT